MNLDVFCDSCGKPVVVLWSIISQTRASLSVRPCVTCRDAAFNRGAANRRTDEVLRDTPCACERTKQLKQQNRSSGAKRRSGIGALGGLPEIVEVDEDLLATRRADAATRRTDLPCSCEVYQYCEKCNPEKYREEVARRSVVNPAWKDA